MAQIIDLLLNAFVDHLTGPMRDDVAPTDLTYADILKVGLLQENKITKNVGIGVLGGDHDDPNYMDGIVTLEAMKNIAMEVPPREIGGGQMWWRRGTIKVECFFIREGLTELEATEAAYTILGRIQANIENINLTGIEDEFGERAVKAFCYGNTFFESGGQPRSFIFRGKVFWAVLTERP